MAKRGSLMMQSLKEQQADAVAAQVAELKKLISRVGGIADDDRKLLLHKLAALDEETDDMAQQLSVMDMSLMDARVQNRYLAERLRQTYVTNPGSFEERYKMGDELGKGKFGTVYECWANWQPEEALAVKVISLEASGEQLKDVQNEVRLLLAVRSPHIVQMVETFAGPDSFFLVMEKVEGGELLEHLAHVSRYTEQAAREGFRQLVQALQVLRHHSIVHRDLKPENLLLTRRGPGGRIKLADFGLAVQLPAGERLREGVGSPGYIAPEVLRCLEEEGGGAGRGYDFQADMWSAGCILFILLCGEPPFAAPDTDALFDAIAAAAYAFPPDSRLSDEARALVAALLVPDDAARLSCAQVPRHPWMSAAHLEDRGLDRTRDSIVSFNSHRRARSSLMGGDSPAKELQSLQKAAHKRRSVMGVLPVADSPQPKEGTTSLKGSRPSSPVLLRMRPVSIHGGDLEALQDL